jgi:hypothetical protein
MFALEQFKQFSGRPGPLLLIILDGVGIVLVQTLLKTLLK